MPGKLHTIKAEDLYRFQIITDMRISPCGEYVVYSLQRVQKKDERKFSNLWMVKTSSGSPWQFTQGDQSDTNPIWSPDGKQIAFLSKRGDDKQSQIYLIPVDGGEARRLTTLDGNIAGFNWSSDGKKLLLSFRKTDIETIEREKDEQKKKLGVVSRHYDRVYYKWDGEGYRPHERWHIWTVDSQTGKAKQLTDHKIYDEHDPVFSPDGNQILFISNRAKDPDFATDEEDLYLIQTSGGNLKKIPTFIGVKGMMQFSPDGKWIAFFGSEGKDQWHKNNRLWIVRTDGKGKPRCLTSDYDFNIGSDIINDVIGAPGPSRPTWSNDGTFIYFQVTHHGNTALVRINVETEDIEDIITDEGIVGQFEFDSSQEKLVWFFANLDNPGQIFIGNMGNNRLRKLTKVNENWLSKLNLGEIEEIWFKGPDNNDLQGWILKPPGFDPKKKYPAILEIHGGPLPQYGNLIMHEFYYLAASGYVVFYCNPRGGQGYGEEHAKGMYDWGGKDYNDIMAWTDFVVKKSYIDKTKLGVTGGSYGGYMTNWIITHTNRFKAAVTQRSVSNITSKWGSSDYSWGIQVMFGRKPPWENIKYYWDRSPMAHMGNAKTPTLIIHSENDFRCNIEQGEQVFVALKVQGIDTEMVRFPDESHGLSRGGRTDRRIERLKHIRRWFDKYLK